MEDKESGKIIGKALMQVYHRGMDMNFPSGYINYTISIYIRDGRYKYEITNFHHTGQYTDAGTRIPDYGACEGLKDGTTIKKFRGLATQKTFDFYLSQMDNNIKGLIIDLKAAMTTKATNTKNDEW